MLCRQCYKQVQQSNNAAEEEPELEERKPRGAKAKAVEKMSTLFLSERSTVGSSVRSTGSSDFVPSQPLEGTETPTEKVNAAMMMLSNLTGVPWTPILFQLHTPLTVAAQRMKQTMKKSFAEMMSIAAEALHPGSGEDLFQFCLKNWTENDSLPAALASQLGVLISAYKNASTRKERRIILSLAALHTSDGEYLYTKNQMMDFFNCSKRSVQQARLAAAQGIGSLLSHDKNVRIRLDMQRAGEFLDFLIERKILQFMSWGQHTIKFESGAKAVIGAVMKTSINSHIIEVYQRHCQRTGTVPLSNRTVYRILDKVVGAQQSRALAGLDNIAEAGSKAFVSLEKIIEQLKLNGVIQSTEALELKQESQLALRYLKGDFVAHVLEEDGSRCGDHCRYLGLSDPGDPELQHVCSSHDHDLACSECDRYTSLFSSLREKIGEVICDETEEELYYDLKEAEQNILSWKAHILRVQHQDKAKKAVLDALDETSGLLIIDWAMKVLPARYRESMKAWYGKRGMSMAGFVLVTRSNEEEALQKFTYVVFLDSCSQDTKSVMGLYDYVLQQVHRDFPKIERIYDKMDNAGCFHNHALLQFKAAAARRSGLEIVRTDFNDPYSGKDQADRDFAVMKGKLRAYVNSGGDLLCAMDLKKALEECPIKIKGAKYAVVELVYPEEEKRGRKQKVPSIQNFHSFQYEESGIRCWRYFEIGPGSLIPYTEGPFGEAQVVVQGSFEDAAPVPGLIARKRVTERQDDTELITCEEPGCASTFKDFADLEQHLLLGKHSFEVLKESAFDQLKRKYAAKLKETAAIPLGDLSEEQQELQKDLQLAARMGHALPLQRKVQKFLPEQVQFLREQFEAGICARQEKTVGSAAARTMRTARDEHGRKIFKSDQYLTESQCTSYFSRLFSKMKIGKYQCLSQETSEAIRKLYGVVAPVKEQAEVMAVPDVEGDEVVEEQMAPEADFEAAVVQQELNDLTRDLADLNGTLSINYGDYVAFVLPSEEGTWTIGQVTNVSSDGMVVKAMQKRNDIWRWPQTAENMEIHSADVLTLINEPIRTGPRKRTFILSKQDEDIISESWTKHTTTVNPDESSDEEMIETLQVVEPCLKPLKRRDDDSEDDERDPSKQTAGTKICQTGHANNC